MDKLNNCQNAITKKTFEEIVSPWLKNLKIGDLVSVISYPGSDRRRRLNALINDKSLQNKYLDKKSSFHWVTIDLRINKIEKVESLEDYILNSLPKNWQKESEKEIGFKNKLSLLQKKHQLEFILAIIGAETIIFEKNTPLLLWLIEMNRFNILRVLLFFEANIFSKTSLDFLNQVAVFQPRIHDLSLYEKKDVEQFITHLQKEHRWILKLKDQIKKEIIKNCGGALLLIKEALWYLRDYPNASLFDIFNHKEMRFTLSFFWNSFEANEKETLMKIALNEEITDIRHKPSLEYLLLTKVISPNLSSYKITVPLLENYIKEQNKLTFYPELKGSDIVFNGSYITSDFSKSERSILTYLIQNPNKLVLRDQLASLIWGKKVSHKYSDWAIDSTLSRLRKKLIHFGISKAVLKTMKGEGVIFVKP